MAEVRHPYRCIPLYLDQLTYHRVDHETVELEFADARHSMAVEVKIHEVIRWEEKLPSSL